MKYSIITVNYNNKEGLRKTIESVIHQTYRDFEYIVIDGGSTDGSAEVLKEYDKEIDYWISEPDKGIYNAMNKGIAQAHGDYLNFMNSGDCFYTETVLQQVEPHLCEASIIVGHDYHYDANSGLGFSSIHPIRFSMLTLYLQALPHQSTFYNRKLFNKTPYDETLRMVADHKFNIQKLCIENQSISFIEEIVCLREPNGISDRQQDISHKESRMVLSQILPSGTIKDYNTLSYLGKHTVFKLMNECENVKARRLLIYCIKIIYRLFKCKNT